MAVSRNLYTQGLRQRLGGATWSQLKGQTIVRELPAAVSNPRTNAQMTQRMKVANLVGMYRVNRPWMFRGAFETKAQTWSDYNAFFSANAGQTPAYLTKEQAAAGAAVVAPYVVSRGSLPPIQLNAVGSSFVSNVAVGTGSVEGTVAELSAAIIAANNGIYEGDQISLIVNYQGAQGGVPYVTARYYEYIVDTSNTVTFASLGIPMVVVDGNLAFTTASPAGVAFILSRTNGGSTRVSTQNLVLNTEALANLAIYQSNTAAATAIASYGSSGSNFLDAGLSRRGDSNANVPLSTDILYVNGVPVGGVLQFSSTDETAYFEIQLNAESPGEITEARLSFTYTTDGQQYTNQSSTIVSTRVNGSIVEITFGGTPPMGGYVRTLTYVQGGISHTATFSLPSSGGGDSGDLGA